MPKFMSWLNENGAYCDCEILQNVEPQWFQAFSDEELQQQIEVNEER